MTKQLKAIIETREFVEREVKGGHIYHSWFLGTCALCKEFWERDCKDCPFHKLTNVRCGCQGLTYELKFDGPSRTPIEYVLSFLIDLEDCYKRMEEVK